MAGKVDGDDLLGSRQGADLRAPVGPVTRPAVDEDEGRPALTLDLEVHGNAIRGLSDILHRAATWRPRLPGSRESHDFI